MDWDQFFINLSAYVADMHTDYAIICHMDKGHGTVIVTDADRNTWVWELHCIGEVSYPIGQGYTCHNNPYLIRMARWATIDKLYECVVPTYPWVVGAILFS